jgi:hypothetical protein
MVNGLRGRRIALRRQAPAGRQRQAVFGQGGKKGAAEKNFEKKFELHPTKMR